MEEEDIISSNMHDGTVSQSHWLHGSYDSISSGSQSVCLSKCCSIVCLFI